MNMKLNIYVWWKMGFHTVDGLENFCFWTIYDAESIVYILTVVNFVGFHNWVLKWSKFVIKKDSIQS